MRVGKNTHPIPLVSRETELTMKTRTVFLLVILFSLLSFAAGWLAFPYLPENIATHWNAVGQADGFSAKTSALTFNSILILVLGTLMLLLPRLDPLRANLAGFIGLYHGMIVVIAGFMLYIQVVSLLLNLGWQGNIIMLLLPAFAVLFYFTGLMVEKSRRNWFIGIRNPWTLSNDLVWEKTHRLGGRLFKWTAVICLFGLLFPQAAFFFMIIPAMAAALILMVYSNLIFRKIAQ
jgi:uncharacterized membrane protein